MSLIVISIGAFPPGSLSQSLYNERDAPFPKPSLTMSCLAFRVPSKGALTLDSCHIAPTDRGALFTVH